VMCAEAGRAIAPNNSHAAASGFHKVRCVVFRAILLETPGTTENGRKAKKCWCRVRLRLEQMAVKRIRHR
jgi:hypothetical protein